MNTDQFIKEMEAFEEEGAEYITPCNYAKIRPVKSPQIYGWMRSGVLSWKHCDCGRRVINMTETDELMRSKGKLPPKKGDDDDDSDG